MTTKNSTHNATAPGKNELVITRIFDAPRELVWKAWTQPEMLKRWWGPKNFTAPHIKQDFRVGGKYLYCMHGAPGPGLPDQDFWSTGEYKEIVPLKRIVCTDNFADKDGNIIPASQYGMPGEWPESCLVIITFEEVGGKTKMTLRHVGIPEGMMSEMTGAGWNQSFDKLAASLKN